MYARSALGDNAMPYLTESRFKHHPSGLSSMAAPVLPLPRESDSEAEKADRFVGCIAGPALPVVTGSSAEKVQEHSEPA